MIRSATTARSRWPCIRPATRARLVCSQPCCRLASVVSRSDRTIVLMLSFSSATSPCASTEMDLVRSPVVTALVTWEIARTWRVRFPASSLTFSVSRFQVPDTPSTSACPPSLPSRPTSRATRVTSAANDDSWSTIVLIVVLSARISPRASTSIFLVRSPWATAVVTWAMFRTWLVRLLAIELTLSVRSFQVPATLGTAAWPPSMPSVPTSRATRVTSPANADSVSTIVLMVSLSSRISPRASTRIFWLRSPLATAVATWAIDRTCTVRLPAMKFTDSVRSRQVPPTPGTCACPPRRPSVPTSRAIRVTSPANADSWSTIVLTVFLSSRISPRASTVIFWLRSPLATAVVTWAMFRTWLVRLPAMKFTDSVRSRQVPPTPGTSACPPRRPSVPTSRATRVTSPANADSWSTIPLMVSASVATSPLASTAIFWLRSPLATAVVTWAMFAHLAGQVARHRVDGVGEALPAPRDLGYLGLAAELAVDADLAGHPGHLGGEHPELLAHRVEDGRDLVHQRVVDLGQPGVEIAPAHRGQPREQLLKLRLLARLRGSRGSHTGIPIPSAETRRRITVSSRARPDYGA